MNLKLAFLTIFSALGLSAFAQQTEKAALATAAPVMASDSIPALVRPAATMAAPAFQKGVSYSVSAGAMGSNLGFASYVSPAAHYRVSPMFSAFTRFTMVNSQFSTFGSDKAMPMATRNYFVHVGGAYDVSDKLQLSGSVWRDFSGATGQFGGANSFRQPARYGADFNAHYKISENFSIFGSIRTSSGNPFNPYLPYNSPMGFPGQPGF